DCQVTAKSERRTSWAVCIRNTGWNSASREPSQVSAEHNTGLGSFYHLVQREAGLVHLAVGVRELAMYPAGNGFGDAEGAIPTLLQRFRVAILMTPSSLANKRRIRSTPRHHILAISCTEKCLSKAAPGGSCTDVCSCSFIDSLDCFGFCGCCSCARARPGMSARLHHVRRLTVIATRGRSAFRRFTPRQATCKEE